MDLRVGDLEGDVSEPLRLGKLTGTMDHGRGHVDPHRAALRGDTRRFTGGLPGPTSDIQDAVVAPDTPGPAERFVVQPQLGVKVDRASPRPLRYATEWAVTGSNRRPLRCKRSALPLS